MSFTSPAVVLRRVTKVMSAIDPTGTGARIAIPSKRSAYSGSARVVASAAPVVAGTRFAAAARPRRKRLFGPSTSACDAVYACTVVITAFAIPTRRPMTSTMGVIQFVVQLAQEMITGTPLGAFAPWTTVYTSPPFDGADRRTIRAP